MPCPPSARRERCFDFAQHDKMHGGVSPPGRKNITRTAPPPRQASRPPKTRGQYKGGEPSGKVGMTGPRNLGRREKTLRNRPPVGAGLARPTTADMKNCPSLRKRGEQRSCGGSSGKEPLPSPPLKGRGVKGQTQISRDTRKQLPLFAKEGRA